MKPFVKVISIGGFVWLLLLAAFIYLWRPSSPVGTPLLVTRQTTPEGVEICITQIYRGVADLYDVSLFVRRTGDPYWNWYYLAHEDFYWRGVRMRLEQEGNAILITRGRTDVARFDWQSMKLLYLGQNRPPTGPQGVVNGSILDRGLKINSPTTWNQK